MCGIYGSTKQYEPSVLKEKLGLMKSRGPDFSDSRSIDDKVWLGHNRLAIIDLDPRSNQPFQYRHLWLTFNGEIYNFQAVRKALEKEGFSFSTASDTEVICAAYLHYGDRCVEQFNGMFAFAIYDTKKNRLFGARDRLGKKPFYYTLKDGHFEFASQLGPIRHQNSCTVDQKAVAAYLTWGYVPDPQSICKEIRKLPAGHSFSYDLNSRQYNEQPYWDLNYEVQAGYTGNYEQAREELKTILLDAVKVRMHADVPLGVFLSGGIDSSLIATLAQQNSSRPIRTFSVKFNEKEFDESSYAQEVAAVLHTNHTTIPCDYQEGLKLIENFSDYYDEPFADASAIPMLLLTQHTRQHVTVALSGDGGDESFLGYQRYTWIRKAATMYRLPGFLRLLLAGILQKTPGYRLQLIGKGLRMASVNELYRSMMGGVEQDWIIDKPQSADDPYFHILQSAKPLLERVSDYDIKTYLNGDINTKVDRATMGFSLESRAPLMDYHVVDFARKLPTHFKYQPDKQKRILKDILYESVPKSLFDRPKSGFSVPLKSWFRNELKDYVTDHLNEHKLKEIPGIKVPVVMRFIEEHMSGRANRSTQIWKLLVLSQWLEKS